MGKGVAPTITITANQIEDPPANTIRCNTDAAWRSSTSQAGLGWVFLIYLLGRSIELGTALEPITCFVYMHGRRSGCQRGSLPRFLSRNHQDMTSIRLTSAHENNH
ncbi:hypothetical protein HID58_066384 [Brassica napus]|uniref:Uncharacterized protein n=1 Tax=Brassica napus TaxID=3708 RepID=A0ABQ7ZFH3_BRANA|nr:hypothetical protein HID58_066384 [Brassica napus]